MKKFTRVFALLMAVVMVLSMSTAAFAATPETISAEEVTETSSNVLYEATYRVSSDSGITLVSSSGDSSIMPLSSVGGFNQKGMWGTDKNWGDNNYLFLDCSGSGYGGMGITIKTSCSYGNYQIQFAGAATAYAGDASTISGEMGTIDEVQFHNLWQRDLQEYFIVFAPADGVTYVPDYFVQVWIYG